MGKEKRCGSLGRYIHPFNFNSWIDGFNAHSISLYLNEPNWLLLLVSLRHRYAVVLVEAASKLTIFSAQCFREISFMYKSLKANVRNQPEHAGSPFESCQLPRFTRSDFTEKGGRKIGISIKQNTLGDVVWVLLLI
jgi:hypothetical protein